ncbi:MAG: mechanosensitive ion channel protein MscS, partial [Rhizobiales bacterium 32-66-8]
MEGLRANDLDDLRNRLDPLRRDITARSEDIAPRLSKVRARIQELGAAPAANAAPEDPNITADRQHLAALAADMEAVLKQNRALSIRGEQVSDTISTRRRALFTGQLFDRSASILDPRLWGDAASAFSVEFRALNYLANDWAGFALRQQEWPVVMAMAVGSVLIFAAIYLLGRKLRHRLRCPPPEDGQAYPRFRAARESVKVTVFNALITPAAALAAYAFLAGFELIPPRVADVLNGLMVAVFIQSIGHALGRGVLAPSEPWRRLLQISDRTARLSYRYFSWTIWTLSIAAFLNALHRALFAPLALTVATSALMSLLIGSFIARSLIALAREADAEEETSQTPDAAPGAGETPSAVRPSVRFLVWLALALLMGALVAGYVSFAAFVSARMVIATAVVGGLYLLNALIDSFFLSLRPDTHHARLVSKTLGLRPNRLELIGIVLAAILKLVLVLSAGLLVMGTWGASTADVMDSLDRVAFGVRIGNTTITLWNVVYALVLLMIGVLLARGLQKWIASQFLPRTGLEPSLQASIATIIGYVGMILAIAVAMGEVGLNLENIALVAGALSVGIGFGLQSIVSNFVSGLILLAERPIRVGDTINVKGEEGYVRRISVRSTEIETFERSTVIVPNSDLITGMVKNFTHSNTTGRVIVAINATYDADLEEVRDILVSCACDHPQVLQSPPPRVFISKLLDAGIVFELRCVVANVDYALTVKSDLHFSILSRFRKAGVGLACQPWAALARAPGDMVPPAPEKRAPALALPLGEPSA